jgi:type I restriction enzyme S subunit
MTMNPDWILKHFDQISEAPDAVPRLRRFILDLAVRGKLVEQDPVDEPASKLLNRIETEKERFTGAGAIRDRKLPIPIETENARFQIPKIWKWARIEDIAYLEMGQSPSSEFYNQHHEGLPFFQGKADFGKIHPTPRYWCTSPTKLAEKGDILISVRAPVGPTNVSNETCCIGRGLAALRSYQGYERDFLLLCLKKFEADLEALGAGTTFVAINRKHLATFPVPLPPLAEQHRIVAKVDELMALCDGLEAAQAKRERRRDRLVAATLHGLGRDVSLKRPLGLLSVDSKRPQSSSENGGFGETALPSFFLNHLPHLTTRPEHIQQLRQTILNLAVRGKLVPQDPTDEPASKLLARIRDRRTLETGKEKKTQMPQPLPLNPLNAPFILPAGWAWARFPDLGIFGRGKSKHRPRNDPFLFEGGTHLFVQTGDVARSKGVIGTFTDKYNDAGLAQSAKWPKGTLCITIAANIADSGILSFDACFPDSVVGFIPAEVFPNARYFEYFIRTAKAELLEYAPATAQKNINISILNEVLIPLPPLVEQHRIVGKVDKLMALCDELEARLTTTATNRRQLLKATLSEAIAS